MVRLARFAAANDAGTELSAEPVGETVEAQESRLALQYQRALEREEAGEKHLAEVEHWMTPPVVIRSLSTLLTAPGAVLQADLRELLCEEPAVKLCSSSFSRQLRHLALRNLGGLLVQRDETAEEALRLFVEALEVDPDDIVLWHRAGTLVSPWLLKCFWIQVEP